MENHKVTITGPSGESVETDTETLSKVADNMGHNSPKDVGGIAGERLKSFIDRVERLEEEKAAIASDIKDIYAEAKGTGFDAKTIRKIVAQRKLDAKKRRQADELLDLYKSAIGME